MRRPGGTLLLVCAAVILAGCGGSSPAPPAADASSEAQAPQPSVGAVVTAVPPAEPARGPLSGAVSATPEAAATFARHWFELLNVAYETGDPGGLLEVSDQECRTCTSVSRQVRDRYEAGGHIVGGAITVLSAEASALDDAGLSLVSVVYRQEPLVEKNADGTTATRGTGETKTVGAFYAKYEDDRWVAYEIAHE